MPAIVCIPLVGQPGAVLETGVEPLGVLPFKVLRDSIGRMRARMKLGPGEPEVAAWNVIGITELIARVLPSSSDNVARVLAVDGRSGGGKSTLARRIGQAVPRSVVVHTDDVAWHHSFFDWQELMIDGILKPIANGQGVAYRPSAWEPRGRPGAIEVQADAPVVIVEGVGASRIEFTPWLTASIWIQSDLVEAERRGLERDGGTAEAKRFWDEWMAAEFEFLKRQKPWRRARVIVNGTPMQPDDSEREVVVAA